ncbi:sigma-70 family RNA polymerase sigma factor [Shewanella sp. JM162201]|uniref:Sigma-70 family RNA polymerase sigma factor n=1 Tax=Shewanella jiangmenensis TaxID=2837387 RepID=A0ABS5V0B2_9GAMM|nr:sigma-70 family RNA polymerase sigma factor [Shewanella jiangmenensis]MBT1443348.1 sigma-70 family RNA polymerase sigma factor [Shewanella jiangmenensis]
MTAIQSISLPGSEDDELLMQRYGAGDIKAFETLYQRHKGGLYRYFVRQIGDSALAEDLYQETWGRVIKAAPAYEATARFSTWLYRIAHNLLIDHVRAVKPLNEAQEWQEELHPLPDGMTPAKSFEQERKVQALRHCISLLPQVQKEAFLLSSEMGFTAPMISDIASVSLEATKSRIRYAYQSLKSCLAQRLGESDDER